MATFGHLVLKSMREPSQSESNSFNWKKQNVESVEPWKHNFYYGGIFDTGLIVIEFHGSINRPEYYAGIMLT